MGVFWIYVVRCNDGTLYTGYTTDVDARVTKHNTGRGAKYTRSRLPVSLVYTEAYNSKSEALRREATIKSFNRSQKLNLIGQMSDVTLASTQK